MMRSPAHDRMGKANKSHYLADRINQETPAIALELHTATQGGQAAETPTRTTVAPFDRHAGVGETSSALYRIPSLVDLSKAGKNDVTLPEHLNRALPQVKVGDRVATQVFLAEALKPTDTGKHTSTREMTATGVWSELDTREATADRGHSDTDSFVNAAVAFIEKWKAIRPVSTSCSPGRKRMTTSGQTRTSARSTRAARPKSPSDPAKHRTYNFAK